MWKTEASGLQLLSLSSLSQNKTNDWDRTMWREGIGVLDFPLPLF